MWEKDQNEHKDLKIKNYFIFIVPKQNLISNFISRFGNVDYNLGKKYSIPFFQKKIFAIWHA